MQISLPDLPSSEMFAPVVLIVLAIQAVKLIYVFHDDYLAKRRFKRLTFLMEEASGNADLVAFVRQAKQELVFAGALGRSASPRLSAAIIELSRTQLFSIWELKYIRFYVRVKHDGQIDVQPGWFGLVLGAFSAFSVATISVYTTPLLVALIRLNEPAPLLGAIVLLLGISILVFSMLREVLEVGIAWRIRQQLRQYRSAGHTVRVVTLERTGQTINETAA
jgi:hypothetical protein